MERFIHTENIKNYRLLLSDPDIGKDPVRRAMLVRLLAGELAKHAESKPTARDSDHFEANLLAHRRHTKRGVEFRASTVNRAK
jgi:hypothetical protein